MVRRAGAGRDTSSTGDPTDPAAPRAGLWEDFVDIFYAPSTVFARRSDGKFGYAMTWLVGAIPVLFGVLRS